MEAAGIRADGWWSPRGGAAGEAAGVMGLAQLVRSKACKPASQLQVDLELVLQPCVTAALLNPENKMTDRGPTVINTGRSSNAGWAVAVVLAVLAVAALLMFTGVININGGGGTDVNVNVPAATTAPATAPAADTSPAPAAAPSTEAPAAAPAEAPAPAAPSN